MKAHVGALLFGAAVLSLLVPKRRRGRAAPQRRQDTPRRMFALVQTRPSVAVLALSSKVEELEREIAELNETWNHWALRSERRRFEIQAAPVLVEAPPLTMRSREEAAPRG